MPTVYWIASYPRSGNTWLRFLLTSLVRGQVEHSDQVAAFVQDIHVHQKVTFTGNEPRLLKTHWSYHDQFPFSEYCRGAVYIVRHPAAVLESALNFHFLQRGSPADERIKREVARKWVHNYIELGGRRSWILGHAGTWAENVSSWIHNTNIPVLTVRYEDLRISTANELKGIAEFLGILHADCERAVENTSVSRMAALEEAELASERPSLFNNPGLDGLSEGFRQVGSASAFRLRISEEERARVVERNRTLCERFGYTI